MKKIESLHTLDEKISILESDQNDRKINAYLLEDVHLVSLSDDYPGIVLATENNHYSPYFERVMSLGDSSQQKTQICDFVNLTKTVNEPVFYFVYNTDNYYHFIYDSLPYLITYRELKKRNIVDKLLIPNSNSGKLYPFFYEFLDLLDIDRNNLFFLDKQTLYKKIYISDSYTHGHDSNLPPRVEIYQLYEEMKQKVSRIVDTDSYPKKIYISRRSWIHGDFSNIGTNYTQRRRLVIEDDLVEFLEGQGFTEVFTEKLSTQDKIGMMMGAQMVVGAIGGGMCNLLFTNKDCKNICICSPHFLSINSRFIFSFSGGVTNYFLSCYNTESDRWKKWMRIKWGDRIGEIKEVHQDYLVVNSSKTTLSGWNSQDTFEEVRVLKEYATELDNGLNSEWSFNLEDFIKFFNGLK
jgi:capsular polysaccharide biosynthesis protein